MYKTALTAIFLSAILALQVVSLPKPATGAIVNSLYIVLFLEAGLRHVAMLAVLSPALAFFTGHLAPPLLPLAPVLAAGNVLMIVCYRALAAGGKVMRILAPSVAKAFLVTSAGAAISGSVSEDPATRVAFHVVVAIQFFTAAAGIYLGEYICSRISKLRGKLVIR